MRDSERKTLKFYVEMLYVYKIISFDEYKDKQRKIEDYEE